MSEITECIKAFIDHKNNISAMTAIAAIRTASRNIKLSTEAYMTISTLAGFNKNADSVCKHNLSSILYLNYVNCLELTFTN